MKRKMAAVVLGMSLMALAAACGTANNTANGTSGQGSAAVEQKTNTVTGSEESSSASETSKQDTSKPNAAADNQTDGTEAAKSQSTQKADSTTQAALDETESKTWKTIQEYGTTDGHSNLSFSLQSKTLKEEGSYYSIEAQLAKPIVVPKGMKVGDTCTITVNELTGTKQKLTLTDEKTLTNDADKEMTYYYYEDIYGTKDGVVLYQDSDDRVDAPFFIGKIRIKKDAKTGAAILKQEYQTIKKSDLENEDPWFNGITFDADGYATDLIFFGD